MGAICLKPGGEIVLLLGNTLHNEKDATILFVMTGMVLVCVPQRFNSDEWTLIWIRDELCFTLQIQTWIFQAHSKFKRSQQNQSCGVGGFGWRRIPSNTRSRSRIFAWFQLRKSNWIVCLHHFPKLRIPVEMAHSYETFIEIENSCCVPRFPLSVS